MASKDADYDVSKLNVQRSDIPTRKLLLTLLAISLGTVIECECLILAGKHGIHCCSPISLVLLIPGQLQHPPWQLLNA
jgi:hypothetical protein